MVRYCRSKADAHKLTGFQLGIVRSAAADILLSRGDAATAAEALNMVLAVEMEPFSLWPAAESSLQSAAVLPPPPPSSALLPPPPPPPAVPGAAASSSSVAASARAQLAEPHQEAVALQRQNFIQGTATSPDSMAHRPSASAAASTGEAWLAPEEGPNASASSGSHNNLMSSAALPPQQGGSGSAFAPVLQDARQDNADWVWQVRAGKKKKLRWLTVADDCAEVLEHAYLNNLERCTWVWDGWTYSYEMFTMTQSSPSEDGTQRRIRRIHRTQVDGDDLVCV